MSRIRWQMVREDGPVVEPFKDAGDVATYLIQAESHFTEESERGEG